jgi:hypothetical protein
VAEKKRKKEEEEDDEESDVSDSEFDAFLGESANTLTLTLTLGYVKERTSTCATYTKLQSNQYARVSKHGGSLSLFDPVLSLVEL